MRTLLSERFCTEFDDRDAMIDAYQREDAAACVVAACGPSQPPGSLSLG